MMLLNRCRTRLTFLIVALAAFASPVKGGEPVQRQIRVDSNVELHVIDSGPAEGSKTEVVLIPGWSTSSLIWGDMVRRLSASYRVVTFDPRSQGRSSVGTAGNTPEQRAKDLKHLIRVLNIQRPVLVGWSQGAQDLAAYAQAYGSADLAGIVFVDASVSAGAKMVKDDPSSAEQTLVGLAVFTKYQRDYLEGMFKAIIKRPPDPQFIPKLISEGMKTPVSIAAAMLVSDLLGPDRTGGLSKISCPTLIVASSEARDLAAQKAMAKKLAGPVTFELFEDAGHALFIDQPDRFQSVIMTFLGGMNKQSTR